MAVTTNSDNMVVDGTDSDTNQNDLMAITTDFDSNSYPNRKGLPLELLFAILKSPHIIDCIGLGNMCVCWCSAAAGILHPHMPQSQFILFDGSNSFVQVRLPQLQNLHWIGSSHSKFITGSHLQLLSTFPEVGHHPELDADGNHLYQQFIRGRSFHQALDYFGKSYIWTAFICLRTSAIICLKIHLAFCLPSDQTSTMNCNWSSTHDPRMYEFRDDVFYKDDLYSNVSFKISDDFKYTKFETFRDSGDIPRMYLVEADAKLFRVWDTVSVDRDLNFLLCPSSSTAHLNRRDLMVATTNSGSTMVVASDSGPNWNDSMVNTIDYSSSHPNWKDLPPELLPSIIDFLRIVDNIHFGAVCIDWYLAATHNAHQPAHQPPFLLLASDNTSNSDIFHFFDLSIKKFHKIRLPQLRGRLCIGSSDGKLIYIDDRAELHVFNPITGSHFDLPSITTFPDVGDPVLDSDGKLTGYLFKGRDSIYRHKDLFYLLDCYILKVIICPRTSAIVVLRQDISCLAFCLPGDQAWTMIEHAPSLCGYGIGLSMKNFMDVVFYKDALYTITHCGLIFSFKIGDYLQDTKFEILEYYPSRENDSYPLGEHNPIKYLVEADGELLQVLREYDFVKRDTKDFRFPKGFLYDLKTQTFQVHKMNWGTMQWEEIESIGEHALFLGLNTSFSLSARDYPELKANSIYFTDCQMYHSVLTPWNKRDLGLFNLKDETIEPCYPGENDMQISWPPPIWFTSKGSPCRGWKIKPNPTCSSWEKMEA